MHDQSGVRPPGESPCWGFPHQVTGGVQTNPEPDAETDDFSLSLSTLTFLQRKMTMSDLELFLFMHIYTKNVEKRLHTKHCSLKITGHNKSQSYSTLCPQTQCHITTTD